MGKKGETPNLCLLGRDMTAKHADCVTPLECKFCGFEPHEAARRPAGKPLGREDAVLGEAVMISIRIQGIPPSLNRFAGRENAHAYRKAKKQWSETVAWMCKMAGLPPAPYQRAEVRIYYHFPDRRRRDPDNYSGKMLLDGLTRGGVIVDDSFGHIRLLLDGWYDPAWTGTEIQVEEIC